MSNQRFTVNLTPGRTAEETANRAVTELLHLVEQINAARIPIVVGPGDALPEGMLPGQPVIDWRTGVSIQKVWDGAGLV